MARPFRQHHLFQIFEQLESTAARLPLDRFLSTYFRSHTAVGSKDRKEICQTLYDMIRWRGLLDHLSKRPCTWQSRFAVYKDPNWKRASMDPTLPAHIRVSFPKTYYSFLESTLGQERAFAYCLASNEPAPTTIRINPAKTSREELLKKWEGLYAISPTQCSPWGITFHKKINFFATPEFKEGLFEVQDESSQLVADLIDGKPGDHVLDYCSGSGGKTLGFAHKLSGKGQLYLHDIRSHILQEAKKRLKRAGIQNVQIVENKKNQLKAKMDWVLVDAPCSGSGTLRRNPDMKWKFQEESLQSLIQTQQQIFEEAFTFLKPGGTIVYATCSIFPQENEEQVSLFKKKFNLICDQTLQTYPESGAGDGFFAAVLRQMC